MPRFEPTGPHAKVLTEYFLSKALAAKAQGLSPLAADFGWKSFLAAEPRAVESIVKDHPGPSDDKNKLARRNHKAQRLKFIEWLKTARGKSTFFFID